MFENTLILVMSTFQIKSELFNTFGVHSKCITHYQENEKIIIKDVCYDYTIVINKKTIQIYKSQELLLEIPIEEKLYNKILGLYKIYKLIPFFNTIKKIVMIIIKLIK